MNVHAHTCMLPSNLNRELIIRFLNKYHKTSYGNTTLITIANYNTFSRLGTICTCLTNNNAMIGVIFSIVISLNIGRSSYTTYLCVRPDMRGKGLAKPLIDATMRYGINRLGVKHGYYLVDKMRRKGCRIHSWYRILDKEYMLDSGFTILNYDYLTPLPDNMEVKKGLHTSRYKDEMSLVHWSPSDNELKILVKCLDFYTIYKNKEAIGVFILTPLECIVEKRVKLGMLTYFHSFYAEKECMAAVIYKARKEDYVCLYGYILGDITQDIVVKNEGHITDAVLYLDFYNHPYNEIDPHDINIPLF